MVEIMPVLLWMIIQVLICTWTIASPTPTPTSSNQLTNILASTNTTNVTLPPLETKNISVPAPRGLLIPNSQLFLYFYDFGEELRAEDARALFDLAVEDANRERMYHGDNRPISGGRWDVDEWPLEITLNATTRATPTYSDVWNVALAIQSFFPIPEHRGGWRRYYEVKFQLRAPDADARIHELAQGSIHYTDDYAAVLRNATQRHNLTVTLHDGQSDVLPLTDFSS